MATSITGEGSPLDDYFRDNGESSDSSNPDWKDAESQPPDSPGSAGEITLDHSRSPMPENKGWTGVQECDAGPSTPRPLHRRRTSMNVSPPGAYALPLQLRQTEAERVAERFKYLICSSGLLEKDWVPGLGRDGSLDLSEPPQELDPGGEPEVLPSLLRILSPLEKLGKDISDRRDLQVAAAVLVAAVGWTMASLVGVVTIVLLAAISSCAFYFARGRRKTDPHPDPAPPVSLIPTEPQSELLIVLSTLLSSSHTLDSALEQSLRLLRPHAPISHQRPLRTALHRLCNSMTDHLASATSSLLEIVDRTELAALAEMYDIPMVNGVHGRRLSDSDSGMGSSNDEEPSPPPRLPAGGVSSPRKPFPPSQSAPAPPSQLRALAMSATHSLPGRARPTHSKHLSLTPSRPFRALALPRTALDDRFTHLPNRTPRLSAHASWDQEAFEAARNEGMRADWAPPQTRARSRPRHERRITEDDEEEVLDGDISGSSDEPRTTLVTPEMPSLVSPTKPGHSKRIHSSPPLDTFIPQKRSPLSRDSLPAPPCAGQHADIFAPNTAAGELIGILPSSKLQDYKIASTLGVARKPAASENPKRRSLQSMTYYPSSATADDLSLTRTLSLPPSDLQALRTASASSSRRPSLASSTSARSPALAASTSLPTRLSPHPPNASGSTTVRRVVSLSPLTLPALKAACLGIHLKRRKMACCLLGLRFTGDEGEEYWEDVLELLGDLAKAMDDERLVLQPMLEAAGKARTRWPSTSSGSTTIDELAGIPPPWALASSLGQGQRDFAPRDSETAKLQQHILALQQGLGEVWEKVAQASSAIPDSVHEEHGGELRSRWSDIREGLGVLVREWERGREVITRLAPGQHPAEGGNAPPEETPPAAAALAARVSPDESDLPEFLQAWPGEDSSHRDLDQQRDEQLATTEELPPQGIDEVYEALPEARLDPLRGLSHDERIRLMKEARGRGLTLKQLVSPDASTGMEGEESRKEQREAGGMVVKELEGMIGMIRRRKGQSDEGTSTSTPMPASVASRDYQELPTTVRRVSREREGPLFSTAKDDEPLEHSWKSNEGFLDDLHKAFVFPKGTVVGEL